MYNKKTLKRMCSFYINEIHLTTMLLPYLEHKINDGSSFYTVLGNGISKSVELLLSKLNLKEDIKKKLEKINWNKSSTIKYKEIEKELRELSRKTNNICILVNGEEKHINAVQKNIERWSRTNEKVNIELIDCYEIVSFNKNIRNILNKHDKIINTSGEHEIEEIFPEYKEEKKEA